MPMVRWSTKNNRMIIGQLPQINEYAMLLPNLSKGLEAIRNAESLPIGKYQFERGYYLIQEGITKPFEENSFEAHRNYIDVQIVLTGYEEIAWLDYDRLMSVIPYDEATDKEKLIGPTTHRILIDEGMFWIAFPSDGHLAVSHSDTPHTYRKVVMKLPINQGG